MLAGLSQCWIFRTPPDFWASAGSLPAKATSTPAAATAYTHRIMCSLSIKLFQRFERHSRESGNPEPQILSLALAPAFGGVTNRKWLRLPIEPHVFHAVPVVDAEGRHRITPRLHSTPLEGPYAD